MGANCIVVPVYKDFDALKPGEIISLRQLYLTLGKYKIYYVGPDTINWKMYLEFALAFSVKVEKKIFDKEYFKDISGYSRLLMTRKFYDQFDKNDYMLIYQLDAFVFKDEFDYWCRSGYDYIGAPWFEGWSSPISNKILGAGNGGFSLRDIKKSQSVLRRVRSIKWLKKYCSKFSSINFSLDLFIIRLLQPYFKIKSTKNIYLFFHDDHNEDIFWSMQVGCVFSDFKVVPAEEAVKFAFEAKPSYLYHKNNDRLPFGCHAWEKYEPEFWIDHIKG